jgi:hypothetical protein
MQSARVAIIVIAEAGDFLRDRSAYRTAMSGAITAKETVN